TANQNTRHLDYGRRAPLPRPTIRRGARRTAAPVSDFWERADFIGSPGGTQAPVSGPSEGDPDPEHELGLVIAGGDLDAAGAVEERRRGDEPEHPAALAAAAELVPEGIAALGLGMDADHVLGSHEEGEREALGRPEALADAEPDRDIGLGGVLPAGHRASLMADTEGEADRRLVVRHLVRDRAGQDGAEPGIELRTPQREFEGELGVEVHPEPAAVRARGAIRNHFPLDRDLARAGGYAEADLRARGRGDGHQQGRREDRPGEADSVGHCTLLRLESPSTDSTLHAIPDEGTPPAPSGVRPGDV